MSEIILTKTADCTEDKVSEIVTITNPTQFILTTKDSLNAVIRFAGTRVATLSTGKRTYKAFVAGDYTVTVTGPCAYATVSIDDILDSGSASDQVNSDVLVDCDGGTEEVAVNSIVSIAGNERPLNVRVVEECGQEDIGLEDQTHALTYGLNENVPAGAKSVVITRLTDTVTINGGFQLGDSPLPQAINFDATVADGARGLLPAISITGGTWQWAAILPILEVPNVNKDDFITQWRTTTPGELVKLPFSGTNNFIVDWGDGVIETITTSNPSHTYAAANDYIVKCTGTATAYGQVGDAAHQVKCIDIIQWGDMGIFNWNFGFADTSVSQLSATDHPSDSSVDMNAMFNTTSFNSDISHWLIPNVTGMSGIFINTPLSKENYDAMLIAFAKQPVISNVPFHGGTANYSAAPSSAASARTTLTGTPHNWVINDGGPI